MKIYLMSFGKGNEIEASYDVYRKDIPGVLDELEKAFGEAATIKHPSKITTRRTYYKTVAVSAEFLKKELAEDTLHLVRITDGRPDVWVNINPITVV